MNRCLYGEIGIFAVLKNLMKQVLKTGFVEWLSRGSMHGQPD